MRKTLPVPAALSLVPAAYPSQSIFGGEVILDARIDSTGTLTDIQTIHGEAPYLEKALVSVRTWTFLPASQDIHSNEPRIGIVFDFVPRLAASKSPKTHNYENASADSREPNSPERAALPVATVEPEYPPDANVQSSVILSADITQQGQLDSVKILRGADPFTHSATTALHQWRFEPGKTSRRNHPFASNRRLHIRATPSRRQNAIAQVIAISTAVPLQFALLNCILRFVKA